VLIDYVMVSPSLKEGANWKVWNPFLTPDCRDDEKLKYALLTASDHFPITIDLPDS